MANYYGDETQKFEALKFLMEQINASAEPFTKVNRDKMYLIGEVLQFSDTNLERKPTPIDVSEQCEHAIEVMRLIGDMTDLDEVQKQILQETIHVLESSDRVKSKTQGRVTIDELDFKFSNAWATMQIQPGLPTLESSVPPFKHFPQHINFIIDQGPFRPGFEGQYITKGTHLSIYTGYSGEWERDTRNLHPEVWENPCSRQRGMDIFLDHNAITVRFFDRFHKLGGTFGEPAWQQHESTVQIEL